MGARVVGPPVHGLRPAAVLAGDGLHATGYTPGVSTRFSQLERNILEVKGVTGEHLARMEQVGIASLADFATVADAATLAELVALPPEVAEKVMAWAAGARAAQLQGGTRGADVVVESADAVYCAHCKTRQPKDYKAGDLCVACGKQAEPIFACYWCGIAGPGRFCRGCGAEFVHTRRAKARSSSGATASRRTRSRRGCARCRRPTRTRCGASCGGAAPGSWHRNNAWARSRHSRGS